MGLHLRSLLAAACLVGLIGTAIPGEQDDAEKKVKQMRKELDELNAKEKAIIKQQQELRKALKDLELEVQRKAAEKKRRDDSERAKRDEADKKKHYVKIELRGRLELRQSPQTQNRPAWVVVTNETTWLLQLADKKDLTQQANKLKDEPVLVKGSITTTRATPYYPYSIDPYDPYPDRFPNRWPQPIMPREFQLPVIVDSIELFKE
jgi:hypothetical protein